MTDLEDLRLFVEKLEDAYTQTLKQCKELYPELNPFDIKDTTGRYILLDSLTALVNAKSFLVHKETP